MSKTVSKTSTLLEGRSRRCEKAGESTFTKMARTGVSDAIVLV